MKNSKISANLQILAQTFAFSTADTPNKKFDGRTQDMSPQTRPKPAQPYHIRTCQPRSHL